MTWCCYSVPKCWKSMVDVTKACWHPWRPGDMINMVLENMLWNYRKNIIRLQICFLINLPIFLGLLMHFFDWVKKSQWFKVLTVISWDFLIIAHGNYLYLIKSVLKFLLWACQSVIYLLIPSSHFAKWGVGVVCCIGKRCGHNTFLTPLSGAIFATNK